MNLKPGDVCVLRDYYGAYGPDAIIRVDERPRDGKVWIQISYTGSPWWMLSTLHKIDVSYLKKIGSL